MCPGTARPLGSFVSRKHGDELPEEPRNVWTLKDGRFHSGDLAVQHPDGYAEVKDRSKDIIISGGENISSLEVEDVLFKHPKIMEAAVVARPDEKWGETPCAFVAPAPGHEDLDEESVLQWCRDNMARFKVPRTIIFGELPKPRPGRSRSSCCGTGHAL